MVSWEFWFVGVDNNTTSSPSHLSFGYTWYIYHELLMVVRQNKFSISAAVVGILYTAVIPLPRALLSQIASAKEQGEHCEIRK